MITLIIAPSQYGIRLTKETYLSPVDPLVWGLFLFWLIALVTGSTEWRIFFPPVFAALFVLIGLCSIGKASLRTLAAKEVIQLVEYFVLAYMLFAAQLAERRFRRQMLLAFAAVTSLIILLALAQYLTLSTSPEDGFGVRGTFGNRNVFSGFLALGIPLLYGLALWAPRRSFRTWFLVTVAVGLGVTLAGGSLLALFFSLLIISILRGQRAALGFVIALLVVCALLPHLPRNNTAIARDSITIYNDAAEVRPRYTEWQAAMEMIREHPWLGVGIGNYQANVGRYYGILPSPPSKAEPDSQNLYLVIAATMGLPGLLAYWGLLLTFIVRAAAAFWCGSEERWTRGTAAGLLGSFVAFGISSIWSPLLVRGIGVPLVWMFALATVLNRAHKISPLSDHQKSC